MKNISIIATVFLLSGCVIPLGTAGQKSPSDKNSGTPPQVASGIQLSVGSALPGGVSLTVSSAATLSQGGVSLSVK